MAEIPRFEEGEDIRDLREKLNALGDALRERTPQPAVGNRLVQSTAGFSYNAQPGRGAEFSPGFIVQAAGEGTIKIMGDGSVVCGPDTVRIPQIDGIGLDTEPPPTIAVADGQTVSLRIEIEPATRQVYVPNTDPAQYTWELIETDFTIVDDKIEVATDQGDERTAVIDQADGTISLNGVAHIPLAKVAVDNDGNVTTKFKFFASKGPLGIQFCASGFWQFWGSMYLVGGSLQTFEDTDAEE